VKQPPRTHSIVVAPVLRGPAPDLRRGQIPGPADPPFCACSIVHISGARCQPTLRGLFGGRPDAVPVASAGV